MFRGLFIGDCTVITKLSTIKDLIMFPEEPVPDLLSLQGSVDDGCADKTVLKKHLSPHFHSKKKSCD